MQSSGERGASYKAGYEYLNPDIPFRVTPPRSDVYPAKAEGLRKQGKRDGL
jgi:hypothetical protein